MMQQGLYVLFSGHIKKLIGLHPTDAVVSVIFINRKVYFFDVLMPADMCKILANLTSGHGVIPQRFCFLQTTGK
jgi:hypothetical protein